MADSSISRVNIRSPEPQTDCGNLPAVISHQRTLQSSSQYFAKPPACSRNIGDSYKASTSFRLRKSATMSKCPSSGSCLCLRMGSQLLLLNIAPVQCRTVSPGCPTPKRFHRNSTVTSCATHPHASILSQTTSNKQSTMHSEAKPTFDTCVKN